MEIISTEELKELIDENKDKEKKDYVLIDVRESDELVHGMIPTAVNVPLDEVEDALSELDQQAFKEKFGFEKPDKDDNIIFHCRTGGRSAQSTNTALSLGFVNAKNFAGSIWAWSEIDDNVRRYGLEPF